MNLSDLITQTYKNGGKVLICGNGGLAAEAEHFTAELMGKFGKEVFIPCIALTANSSLITALSNDYGYEQVFARQVCALGKEGDILIAMTTSASKNIRAAIMAGRSKGLRTICLCGINSPELGAEFTVIAEGKDVATIQEGILTLLHKTALDAKGL